MAEILGRHDEFLEQDVQAPLTPDCSAVEPAIATSGQFGRARLSARLAADAAGYSRLSVPALSDQMS